METKQPCLGISRYALVASHLLLESRLSQYQPVLRACLQNKPPPACKMIQEKAGAHFASFRKSRHAALPYHELPCITSICPGFPANPHLLLEDLKIVAASAQGLP